MTQPHCRVPASPVLRSSNPDICPVITTIHVRF